ncbi:hypothetical protein CC78DRAFT_569581 [Lojkania enalia]|uniref:Rhodopsin domain-containing protein n=1 Tax=Lojkania enalia TaxID=147567 RepID=A0A9P4MYM9_9PLEO|nr:hypothetical protein CC78DRAFT_569581 [Didymosphaeria enalia]
MSALTTAEIEAVHAEYRKVWISKTAVGVVATFTIVLRFIARKKTNALLKWDDWFALAALITMWGDFGATILVPSISFLLKAGLSSIIFCDTCEVVARISVICLYYRLFSVKRWLRWSLNAVGWISVIWLITLILVVSLQCKPVAAVVDASIQDAECLDNFIGFLTSEVINVFLDLALLCLPIPIIMKLYLPLREKIGLGAIFLTGGLVIITGLLRIVNGYNPHGKNSITDVSALSFWTGIHLGACVVCTSLPVFRIYLPKQDGFLNSRVRLLYRSVSGWVGLTSRGTSNDTYLPSYKKHSKDITKETTVYVDEMPLKSNLSAKSGGERSGSRAS